MNINAAFPSKYLKASDLGDKVVNVTIDRVVTEGVGQTKDPKPVVYFVGKNKGVVLNKTNAKRIQEICGSPDTDDWTGRMIALYASETEYQGENVECIRVKAPVKAGKPAPAPAPEPEPNFVDTDADPIPF